MKSLLLVTAEYVICMYLRNLHCQNCLVIACSIQHYYGGIFPEIRDPSWTNIFIIFGYLCMSLWGVALLELDSHPDHNIPDHSPCANPKIHPIDH